MNLFPETRESLLALLADTNNRDAWEQFARVYRPLVYRQARFMLLAVESCDDCGKL